MDNVARFIAYASAFERAVVTNEWDEVAACFAPDAVYEVSFEPPLGGRFEGRAAIVGYLEEILDRLDRRFASRHPELLGLQEEDGGRIRIQGRVRYVHPTTPDLVFELEEIAHIEDGLIVRLEDQYDDANRDAILRYIAEHGPRLGILDR
jgi:ketosteroid isomerase-like protein